MSAHAAVFRNDELMAEGIDKLAATYKRMEDVHVSDRSLIWNSDLIETMPLSAQQKMLTATARLKARTRPLQRDAVDICANTPSVLRRDVFFCR